MIWIKHIGRILLFVFLTLITQVGGVVYLTHLIIKGRWKRLTKTWQSWALFLVLYGLTTFIIVPAVAPKFGRSPLTCVSDGARPATHITCLLNRHYVSNDVFTKIQVIADKAGEKGLTLIYMDACFPFWDGFPLLPHLSHNDGKKIDIAFVYVDANGSPTHSVPNLTGYGMFLEPLSGEEDTAARCEKAGNSLYSATGLLAHRWGNMQVSASHTRSIIQYFLSDPQVEKIFIEPHLKQRWKILNPKIRFQGCHAVRHDDHIHVEFE